MNYWIIIIRIPRYSKKKNNCQLVLSGKETKHGQGAKGNYLLEKKWQEKNRHLVCPLQVRPEVAQINFTTILQHVCKLRLAANCMSALDGRACNQRTGFLPLFGYVRRKRETINKSSGLPLGRAKGGCACFAVRESVGYSGHAG